MYKKNRGWRGEGQILDDALPFLVAGLDWKDPRGSVACTDVEHILSEICSTKPKQGSVFCRLLKSYARMTAKPFRYDPKRDKYIGALLTKAGRDMLAAVPKKEPKPKGRSRAVFNPITPPKQIRGDDLPKSPLNSIPEPKDEGAFLQE